MQIKNILFDFDGTIVHSIPVILETFRDVFYKIGEDYPGDVVLSGGIGKHLKDIFYPLLPEGKREEAISIYRTLSLKKQREGRVSLLPGVMDVLRDISQQGFIMGIVTSKLRSTTEELLERFKIREYFRVVVGTDDVHHCKPHPEPLLFALNTLSASKGSCLYVGDSPNDGTSAQQAGIKFIGVLTGAGSRKELRKFGDVYRSLSEFEATLTPISRT
jgi:pyrophosphatase PpaX